MILVYCNNAKIALLLLFALNVTTLPFNHDLHIFFILDVTAESAGGAAGGQKIFNLGANQCSQWRLSLDEFVFLRKKML
jgi:hypothetical protein